MGEENTQGEDSSAGLWQITGDRGAILAAQPTAVDALDNNHQRVRLVGQECARFHNPEAGGSCERGDHNHNDHH
jgi:hypothetical protein